MNKHLFKQCNVSGNALLIESIPFRSYDELAKKYELFDGDLHVEGMGNQLKDFILYTERDVNGMTYIKHTGLVKVEGHHYLISGIMNNNASFGLLNKTYFIHHGIIKISGNGNVLDRVSLEVREDAGALQNVGIQIVGNGNVLTKPAIHDNRKTSARNNIEFSDIIQLIGMGNIICGIITNVETKFVPSAEMFNENVQNISNPQPTSSIPCGFPCQNNETSYQVQRSVEQENNFIENTTQIQGVQTRDGQVGIPMATISSQTENASSGHLFKGLGKTCQNATEVNSQPAQGLFRELETLRTQRFCNLRLRQNAGVTFAPCGHLASCVDCCSSVDRCPVCLSSIDDIIL